MGGSIDLISLNMFLIYWGICAIGMSYYVIKGIIKEQGYIEINDLWIVVLAAVFSFFIAPGILIDILWDKLNIGKIKLWSEKDE
jgi:hypothetical protein